MTKEERANVESNAMLEKIHLRHLKELQKEEDNQKIKEELFQVHTKLLTEQTEAFQRNTRAMLKSLNRLKMLRNYYYLCMIAAFALGGIVATIINNLL